MTEPTPEDAGLNQVASILRAFEKVEQHPSLSPSPNVTQLRGDAARLKPRAKALLDSVTWAPEIHPIVDHNYLVKGWLDRAALSVIFGPSNGGKSFLAVDLAHHIAKGLPWAGRRVNKGRVLLVAAEGGAGVANRIAALDGPEFWVLRVPITLIGKESSAPALAEMVQHLAATGGPFDLIIVDTMSRVMGGGDENAAPDIADLVRNLDHVRRATGAHIMLVHHTGKDAGRGARGHSSLRAAIDTEIELSRDNETGLITAEVTKQRDGPTGYKFTYRLRQVEVGIDQDGDAVTTCLVEPADTAQAGRAVVTDAALKALAALDKAIAEGGEVIHHPNYPGSACVTLTDWREACLVEGAVSTARDRDGRGKAFIRARADLEAGRLILVRDERVWRVEP